jgi:hypothetical protein
LRLHLASAGGGFGSLVLVVKQVSYATELFGCGLKSLDLLAQLGLLRLFLAQYLVDIPHSISLLIAL